MSSKQPCQMKQVDLFSCVKHIVPKFYGLRHSPSWRPYALEMVTCIVFAHVVTQPMQSYLLSLYKSL